MRKWHVLIGIESSGDRNVIKNETENILKRNTVHVMTVVKGETGTVSKSFRKYLENVTCRD
jgi:hypothetical protein